MVKIKIILIAAFIGWSSGAWAAQTEHIFPYTKVAMPELLLGPGSRIPALGGAGVAASTDLESLYWNPAGLGQVNTIQMSLSHISWIQGINHETFLFGLPIIKGGTLAVGANYLDLGKVEITTVDSQGWMLDENNIASVGMYGGWLGFGYRMDPQFSMGVTLAEFIENLIETRKTAMFANVGIQWYATDHFTLGLGMDRIGMKVGNYNLPTSFKFGFAGLMDFSESHSLLLTGEPEILLQTINDSLVHVGLEYQYEKFLSVRLGYQFSKSTKAPNSTGLSAGMGIKIGIWNFGYTFSPQGDLGSTHRISMNLNIEEMFKPKVKPKKGKRARKAKTEKTVVSLPGSGPEKSGSVVPGGGPVSDEANIRSFLKPNLTVDTEIIESKNESSVVHFRVKRELGARIKQWKMNMLDKTGRVLRHVEGEELPETIGWDAMDENGKAIETLEETRFELTLKDVNGKEEQYHGRVTKTSEPAPPVVSAMEDEGEEDEEETPAARLTATKVFGPVLFDRDRAEIKPESTVIIQQAAEFVQAHSEIKVMVEGYCDSIEEADKKQMLSKARAEAVARYLTAYHKIPLSRILIRGRSDANPIVDNLNPDERHKNRRVMILVKAKRTKK